VGGSLDEDPGTTQIDPTRRQRLPHLGQPRPQINRQVQVGFGCPAGETQRCSDLSRRRVVSDLRIGIDLVHQFGDRSHRLANLGLEESNHPLPSLQHPDPVKTRQVLTLDASHHRRQNQTRFQCVDPRR
jgi:hypothetical protein